MLEKLMAIKGRFEEVGQLIIMPESMADMSKYAKLNKEYKDLEKIVKVYDEYALVIQNLANSKEILVPEVGLKDGIMQHLYQKHTENEKIIFVN
jgi:peptide chain release factor 1